MKPIPLPKNGLNGVGPAGSPDGADILKISNVQHASLRSPTSRLPNQAQKRPPPPFINLCGDYRFLRGGYWALIDAHLNGVEARPTPLQAVTAQNCAASLLVAKQAGLTTATWRVARRPEDVPVPAILVPNSGQTDTYYHVNSPRSRDSQWRSATQNGTRPALAVTPTGKLRAMKQVVGMTTSPHVALAWQVWQTFGIPLATVWYIDDLDGPRFLSLDPLPLHDLTERELRMFEEVSRSPMSPS